MMWPFGLIYWYALNNFTFFRRFIFDSVKKNKILVSDHYREVFLVSSNDKIIGRDIFINGEYDFDKLEKTLSLLGNSFNPNLLIDIGANIGSISIPAIKRNYFKKAMVFEPEPFNFSLLKSNILLNQLSNKVDLFNIALGDTDNSHLKFILSKTNYGDHQVKPDNFNQSVNDGFTEIKVECNTLDSQIKNINPKETLIWIDTQGYEGLILKGAKNTLLTKAPLVIEFWPFGMEKHASYVHLKNCLINSNYNNFYNLNDSQNELIKLNEKNLDLIYKGLNKREFVDLLIF